MEIKLPYILRAPPLPHEHQQFECTRNITISQVIGINGLNASVSSPFLKSTTL